MLSKGHPSSKVELLPGNEFLKITAYPSMPWRFRPAQHCFLYFPTLENPFQSHPFTIATWDHENSNGSSSRLEAEMESGNLPFDGSSTGRNLSISNYPSISFIIRPEHGLTETLHKHLLSSTKSRSLRLFIEGPCGETPSCIHQADTILAVAGGIGITTILSYLTWYLDLPSNSPGRPTRFSLLWTARDESLIRAILFQIEAQDKLNAKGVEIQIVCTSRVDDERLDLKGLVPQLIQIKLVLGRNVVVVSCGPGALADEVRAAVVKTLGTKGKANVELVEEAFCW